MGLFISAAQAATDAGAEGGASGLPQLNLDTFPSQIFWLVVALAALYLLFSRSVLPRISGIIEERSDAVEDDLDRAAEFKRRAEEAEKAYEQALSDARAEAQRIADATRADINKQVEEATAKADAQIAEKTAESEKRIAEIRDDAAAAVHEVALETAQALVEAVAPGAADPDAVKAAVESRTQRREA
jgi:F-type H+-transporting ATPase subunit b